MDSKKLKKTVIEVVRDLLIAFVVVLIIMLILYAYCRIWPPMVVVESGSMMHSDDTSHIGIIDTGDMVFVKSVNGRDDLITYIEGEGIDYYRYGDYGDVVVYRPNGLPDRVPIIHRLILWLEINTTTASDVSGQIDYDNYTFDVPSLNMYGSREDVVLHDYGYNHDEVVISLGGLLNEYKRLNVTPHGGYISMGDHNAPNHDQLGSGSYEPILPEWIVGKAIGELPWFGLIKLSVLNDSQTNDVPHNSWVNLFISIITLICVPLLIDYSWPYLKRRLGKGDGVDTGSDMEEERKDQESGNELVGNGESIGGERSEAMETHDNAVEKGNELP